MKSLKKVGFLLILLMAGMVVNAQNLPINLEVKGGVNLSNFSGDIEDVDPKIGFQVGVTAEYGISEELSILSGLEFTTKGCKYSEDGYKETINPMFIQLPIHAAYRLAVSNDLKVLFGAGPYLAYGIGGKIKFEEDGETEKYDFFGSEEEGGCKRFDFGLGLGVGFEFNKIKVSIGYDYGLANLSRDSDWKLRTQNAYLTVGFHLR